jgi:hypothetical protein
MFYKNRTDSISKSWNSTLEFLWARGWGLQAALYINNKKKNIRVLELCELWGFYFLFLKLLLFFVADVKNSEENKNKH